MRYTRLKLSNTNIVRSKNILLVVIGTLLLAFGTACFVLPNGLITGGVSGLAIILNAMIPTASTTLLISALTWGLFLLGMLTLGRDFALKTLISTVVYPVGVILISQLMKNESIRSFLTFSEEYSEISILLSALLGGIAIGGGCALTFLGGGSTGGVDILAFLICKMSPRLRASRVIFIVDFIIISMGLLLTRDIVKSMLGIACAFVAAIVIDKLFLGRSRALIANIISDKFKEINRDIIAHLGRTSTMIEVRGGYLGQTKMMLMVTFRMSEYATLLQLVRACDKAAFVTVSLAHEIEGYGWTS